MNNSLSTILRTTRSSTITEVVQSLATNGAEPLPKDLARTNLRWVGELNNAEECISGLLVDG